MAFNYRKILAKNVEALKSRTPALNSNSKIAKACSAPNRKIGARTIGHLLNANPEAPQPQLDTIVAVAEAFKVAPSSLLDPYFDADRAAEPIPMAVMDLALNIYALQKEKPEAFANLGLAVEGVSDEEVEAAGIRAPGKPADQKSGKKPPARQYRIKLDR